METFSAGLDNVRALRPFECGGVGGVDVHDGVTNRRCLIEEDDEDEVGKPTFAPEQDRFASTFPVLRLVPTAPVCLMLDVWLGLAPVFACTPR